MPADIQRKLTTILAADAAGYSRAMAADEAGTIADLRASRAIFTRFIERHGGRIANTAGDGLIADFPSVVEAVQCAIEVQTELQARDGASLRFRIGIHLGDVIVDGADLLGDGVNVAARLQGMAEPGGVLISRQVYDHVHSKLTVGFQHLGERQARNLPEDVDVYRIAIGGGSMPPPVQTDFDEAVYLSQPDRAQPQRAAQMQADPVAPPEPPAAPPVTPPATPPAETSPLQTTATRNLLVVSGIALVTDLFTGGGFWAHWVILPALTAYGLFMAPRLARGRLTPQMLRVLIPALSLVAINLITWSGTLWSIWPVAGAVAVSVMSGRRTDKDA